MFLFYHGLPMNDDKFKRPSRQQPEGDDTGQNDLNRTVRRPIAPPPPPESRPSWADVPAVKMYETPIDAPRRAVHVGRSSGSTPPPPPPSAISRESAARQRARRRVNRHTRGSDWAWVIVSGAILFIALLLGMSAVFLLQNGTNSREIIPTATLDIAMLPPAVDMREQRPVSPQEAQTGDIILLGDGTPLELRGWDGESRFTVLLMGIDRRAGSRGLAYLTDTIIIISIDPRANTIGMLSVPRDLYVPVPGYAAHHRINSAMALGETRSPGSGARLAMQTVQNNLGMRIHEYVVVDFQAVIDIVDAIDGVTVTTDYTINDRRYPDMNYGYDPFFLPAGTNQLDGETALKFARTRHGDNDLERARRQQQLIFAIRDKVTRLNMIPNLIVQAPVLFNSLSDNITTGLSLTEMIQLAWFVKDVPRENITTGVIDYRYVQNFTTERGEQVLLPVRSRLGGLLVETFGANYSE
ncbi:MAG: LytR family transcriptional regulator [Anaerolineaceae bacterium]|nr:MAG: LytR family transcriptional regulator [Anaerolineaceae bacterium]